MSGRPLPDEESTVPLTNREIETLLRWVGATREEEIDCDRCAGQLAEFAERVLAKRPLSESLEAVAQHLAVCTDCREDYEALQRGLEELSD